MPAVLLVVAVASLTFVLLGYLGLVGKLGQNRWIGIRSPYTFSSPAAWRETHRAAAPIFLFGGIAAFAISLAFLPFAIADKVSDGVMAAVCLAGALILGLSGVASWIYGTRQARARLG